MTNHVYLLRSADRTESGACGNGGASKTEYRWCSYQVNAQEETDAPLKPRPLYMAFGLNDAGRQRACRELFRYELESGLVDEIRWATNSNFTLGNARAAAQVSTALG